MQRASSFFLVTFFLSFAVLASAPARPQDWMVLANSDCTVDITDGIYVLGYVFLGAAAPPDPGPRPPPGPDPTEADTLGECLPPSC